MENVNELSGALSKHANSISARGGVRLRIHISLERHDRDENFYLVTTCANSKIYSRAETRKDTFVYCVVKEMIWNP
jgi:hypothetical protein